MKKKPLIILVLFLGIFACNEETAKDENLLRGSWAFLDMEGNYTEIHFRSTTFKSVNPHILVSPWMKYKVVEDTLLARKGGVNSTLRPIAHIQWIDNDHVIFSNPYNYDTLERIKDTSVYLGNTDPMVDSARFMKAFLVRYDSFLVRKGILSEEELRKFREEQIIPEDVKNQLQLK